MIWKYKKLRKRSKNIFSIFIFYLPLSLCFKWIFYKRHIFRSCFSYTLLISLLLVIFTSLNVIIDMLWLKTAILLLVLCLFPPFLLFCSPIVYSLFRIHFDFSIAFYIIFLENTLGITVYVHNLLQSTSVDILQLWVKNKKITSFSFCYLLNF